MGGPARIGTSSPAPLATPTPSTGHARPAGGSITSTPTPGHLSAHGSPAPAHGKSTAPRASNASLKNFLTQANQGLQKAPATLNQAADTLQMASVVAQQASSVVQQASALLPHAPKALQQAGSALQTISSGAQLAARHILPIAATVASAADLAMAVQGAVKAFKAPPGSAPGARTGAVLDLIGKTGVFALNVASAQPTVRLAATVATTLTSMVGTNAKLAS